MNELSYGCFLSRRCSSFVISSFADRIFICITQIGKIGSLVSLGGTTLNLLLHHLLHLHHFCDSFPSSLPHTQISASSDRLPMQSSAGEKPAFQVEVLLGDREDPVARVAARQIIQDMSASTNRSLLLGVGLRRPPKEASQAERLAALRPVLETLFRHKTW